MAAQASPQGGTEMIYTVDLGNGQTVQIAGPSGATPEQLQQVIASHPQLASPGASPSPGGAGPEEAPDQMQGGFADELPDQPLSRLSPEEERQYQALLHTGTADQINTFLANLGRAPQWDVSAFTRARDKAIAAGHPEAVNYAVTYALPKIADSDTGGITGAAARGAGDSLTLGLADKAHSLVQAIKDQANGSDDSFLNDWNMEADRTHAIEQYDQENHPWARIAGQLLGGMFLPAGLEGVGLKAGTDVLRAGGTMAEARAAASIAVRNRVIAMSAGYGGAHGALSADTPADALSGAAIEGGLGAITGGIVGGIGSRIAQRVAAPAERADTANNLVQGAENVAQADFQQGQPDYADLAASLNVRPTPATTGGAMAHAAQMAFGNTPGGMSAVAKAVDTENQGLADAARRAAETVGTPTTREAAGEAVAKGAADYRRQFKQEAADLYKARDDAMGGPTAPVRVANTEAAIQDLARQYPNSPAIGKLTEHSGLAKLINALPDNADHELTLGEATEALSHIRGVMRNLAGKQDATGPMLAKVGKVEQALEDDVMDAARAADQFNASVGRPGGAEAAQQKADAFYAIGKAAQRGPLKLALESADDPIAVSGQKIFQQLDSSALKKGGNLKQLREIWFRLPEEAKAAFAATKIDDLGHAIPSAQNERSDVWSYETFLTNFDKLDPRARRIMFGADADKQLQDIATYAARLRSLGRSRNFSNTAKNYISGGILTAIGTALFHGNLGEAALVAGSVPAFYGSAKLYLATPAMRQWTRNALKVALIGDPSRQRAAARTLINELPRIARSEPAIANQVLQLQAKLADAFSHGGVSTPMRAAAVPSGDEASGEPGEADRGNAVGAGQQNQQELRP